MAESNTKKDLAVIAGLFLILAGLVIFGRGFTSLSFAPAGNNTRQSTVSAKQFISGKNVKVKINNLEINALVASTFKDRQKGLSDRDSLPFGEGMLFVFEKDGIYNIWMKDMDFAIDIIWIDKNKKVVDIVSNAAPEPGKKDNELSVYKPVSPSKYILEINAGLIEVNNIKKGDLVDFIF